MFRKLAIRLAVCGVVAAAGVASVAVAPAYADNVYMSTLDVVAPSAGRIDSVDSNFQPIRCGADAPGPCTITDQQTELGGRPTTGWYTYMLQASDGPAGYSWRWTSGCSGMTATCAVVNDQDWTSVSGEWVDTEFPVLTTLRVPGYAHAPVELSAAATDNSGSIKWYVWRFCPSAGGQCTDQFTDTGLTYLTDVPDGAYDVSVYAVDYALNGSAAKTATVVVDGQAPTLSITYPRQNATIDSFNPAVRFAAADSAALYDVRCSVDGGEQFTCQDGWLPGYLANGTHVLSVQARDWAGNSTTIDRAFTVGDPQLAVVGTPASVYGQTARIRVQTVKDSFGNVEFDDVDTGRQLCSKPAGTSGLVACTFAGTYFKPGTHGIHVRYTGDVNHAIANTTVDYVVGRKPSAIAAAPQTAKFGTSYPLTVTGLPTYATGTVQFHFGAKLLCSATVQRGRATCTVGGQQVDTGPQQVSATYSGDAMYDTVTTSFSLTVAKGSVSLTAAPAAPQVHVGYPMTLTASGFASNATGTVTFTSKNGALTLCVATVKKGVATCTTSASLPADHYGVLAGYGGEARWNVAKARTAFDVTTTWP